MSTVRGKKPREITCQDSVCTIVLTKGKVARIDQKDLDKVKDYCWNFATVGYAFNKTCGYLHHHIFGKKEGLYVDHIDGDKLNNTKTNLRFVTPQQSNRNTTKSGATWHKQNKRWLSILVVDGKRNFFGSFKTKKEAQEMTFQKESLLFGEHAFINRPNVIGTR